MPDSQQPPFWGPAYQDRDLDALLSGERGFTPEALRPVQRTLDALRAAPAGRELADEAAARAAFRALVPPRPAWTTAAPPEPEIANPDTLVLPAAVVPSAGHPALAEHPLRPADAGQPRPARHRRRGAAWAGRRPAVALSSLAAVAVIVIAVAVTGNLPGSIGHGLSFGHHSPSASASSAPGGGKAGSLDGRGIPTTVPTAVTSPAVTEAPSVSPSATSGTGTLCRELFAPSAKPNWRADRVLFGDLAKQAGSRDPKKIFKYCLQYLPASDLTRRPYPGRGFGGNPGGPGGPGGPEAGGHPAAATTPAATAIPTATASGAARPAAPVPSTGTQPGFQR